MNSVKILSEKDKKNTKGVLLLTSTFVQVIVARYLKLHAIYFFYAQVIVVCISYFILYEKKS